MPKLKHYIMMDCVSYTIVMALLSSLSVAGVIDPLPSSLPLSMLVVTTAVAAGISLADRLPLNNLALQCLLQIAIVMAVVYVLGGWVFHFAPTHGPWLWLLLAIDLVTYAGVYGVLALRTHADAADINWQIARRKRDR